MKKISAITVLFLISNSSWGASLADSNALFNFAEERYPQYFSPAGQESFELQGYTVRYYPDTNTYVGTADENVYVHGSQFGVGIIEVGVITDFIAATETEDGIIDLTDIILTRISSNCAEFAGFFTSSVTDVNRSLSFTGNLEISLSNDVCTFSSNNIPNHDFGDGGSFATNVSEQSDIYSMSSNPEFAASTTPLTLQWDNAIMLNGVKVDMFAAACYGVGDEKIGCFDENQAWRFDPMSPLNNFGTDNHNAHTQPSGAYHYHGSPNALFDFNSAIVSPVVGFAADGFPVFGSYFNDNDLVRKAESSYRLKAGTRPSGADDPGGSYDGTFRDDYEYVQGHGDLDECNGMSVNGIYGYFITDDFPYMMFCFQGSPNSSFQKGP